MVGIIVSQLECLIGWRCILGDFIGKCTSIISFLDICFTSRHINSIYW